MKQFVKTLIAMLLIAMCLTSDTAVTSAAPTSARLPNSVNTGQRLQYWENPKWIPLQVTPPCEYPLP